jgi:ferrochelatase
MTRTGVLLVNLGTPASPGTGDVRRYLREFLSDPLVIDIPALPRWLLLNVAILPFRPRKSGAAYRKIWTDRGSPLLFHGRDLRDGVAEALGDDFRVALAMRYGEPSIEAAVSQLAAAGVDRWVVLPLFPQYSTAATRSAVEAALAVLAGKAGDAPVTVVGAFHGDPGFVGAFAEVGRRALADFAADHVLFSYHGLPERQIRAVDPGGAHCLASDACCDSLGGVNRDCYRAQCYATTRALAGALGLAEGAHSTAFQSRLGRTPWIRPYTDLVLPELARRGVLRLAIVCPAFVADCLETIEEIGIRARDQWRALGGESLALVPSLNAEPKWIAAVADIVRRHAVAGG